MGKNAGKRRNAAAPDLIRYADALGYKLGRVTRKNWQIVLHPATGNVVSFPLRVAETGKGLSNFRQKLLRGAKQDERTDPL